MRFFNEAIRRCPRLLCTGDTAGKYSCRRFFAKLTAEEVAALGSAEEAELVEGLDQIGHLPAEGAQVPDTPRSINPGVQWWVSSDADVTKVTGILFNTHGNPTPVTIVPPAGWHKVRVVRADSFTADSIWEGFREVNPPPWQVRRMRDVPRQFPVGQPATIMLPAFSVVRVDLHK